jgi:hypothetical protein
MAMESKKAKEPPTIWYCIICIYLWH